MKRNNNHKNKNLLKVTIIVSIVLLSFVCLAEISQISGNAISNLPLKDSLADKSGSTQKNPVINNIKTSELDDIRGLNQLIDAILLTPKIYTVEGISCKSVCEKMSKEYQCSKAYDTNGLVTTCDSKKMGRMCQCISTSDDVNNFINRKKHK